jgi:cold shock CspA family protein
MDTHALHTGTVVAFDAQLGFGDVEDAETKRAYFFHCTQIADGSRTIPVGAAVSFRLAAGGLGRWEARDVAVIGDAPESDDLTASPESAFPCAVCSAPVTGQPGDYEICSVCGWEDDPVQSDDPTARGANTVSLDAARRDWVRRNATR